MVRICRVPGSGTNRRGSAGTSVRVPESQEGACESLKEPIALAIDVFVFDFSEGNFNVFFF